MANTTKNSKRNTFNEATRVQMPALVHLTRLGYSYFGKITEDMAGTIYDPDTNILINIFKVQTFIKVVDLIYIYLYLWINEKKVIYITK